MSNVNNPWADTPAPNTITESPINTRSISSQNLKLLDHLAAGKTINFLQAREMGIAYLNSRISDLRKELTVHSRFIRIGNTKCMEYSLQPFV